VGAVAASGRRFVIASRASGNPERFAQAALDCSSANGPSKTGVNALMLGLAMTTYALSFCISASETSKLA
jgi:hypothetical protein